MVSLKNQLSLRNFVMLTISGLINAFGATVFLAPVSLYGGGISGTSMLLARITPEFMSLSFFLMILKCSPVPVWFEKTMYCIYGILRVYSQHLFPRCLVNYGCTAP